MIPTFVQTSLYSAVLALFSSGTPGAFLDANDWGTTGTGGTGVVFQDAAGTLPVTAMEQPVQLILDKSQGLKLGANVVGDPNFQSPAYWSIGANWAVTGGAAVGTAAGSTGVSKAGILTIGKWYKVTVTVNITSGSVFLPWDTSATFDKIVSTSGTYTRYFLAATTTLYACYGVTPFTGSITNLTVQPIAGNHAYVSASANRAVISARYNLLTKTDFSASWLGSSASVVANNAVAQDGTTTAATITTTAGGGIIYQGNTLTAGSHTTIGIFKAGSVSSIKLECVTAAYAAGGSAPFNLSAGTKGTVVNYGATVGSTSTITALGNGYYLCSLTIAATAATYYTQLIGATIGTFTAWHPDLRPSDQATGLIPPYQRVNTATDYDWSPAFPPMIKGNGSNQYLGTNSIDLTGTSKVTAWVGSRKLSDAALGLLFEHGDVNTGSVRAFTLNAPRTAGVPGYALQIRDATNSVETKVTTGYPAPVTNVITSQLDYSGATIAAQALLRFNGQNVANTVSGTLVSGAFGNYPLNIFWRPSAGLYFNGGFNSLIILGAAATAAQISTTEAYCNQKLRAY